MISNIYEILISGNKVAECYNLDIALIIVERLFNEYYKEPNIEIVIRRIENND